MGIKMLAPSGNTSNTVFGKSGTVYNVAADGSISNVSSTDVLGLAQLGFTLFGTNSVKISVNSPLPADLISIKAAATPANGTITIAAQPPQARKLQVRIVIGTPATTDITAGTLTLVGVDQDGNAITEVISLVAAASVTLKTTNAFAQLVSGTVAGYAADGSGTGNTLGIGLSNDFGIPTRVGVVDFALLKASKITTTITGAVTGYAIAVADDVAATATVDAVARTVAPTTAPAALGMVSFEFTCAFS